MDTIMNSDNAEEQLQNQPRGVQSTVNCETEIKTIQSTTTMTEEKESRHLAVNKTTLVGELEISSSPVVTQLNETLKCSVATADYDDDKINEEMEEVSLQEELDALSPLMIDNHTYLDHHEMMIEEGHQIREFIPASRMMMKLTDTKDSIGSIDSDLSMSFDRRNSQESTSDHHLLGDHSDTCNSSSEENAKDSGCETVMVSKMGQEESGVPTDPPIEIPDDEMAEKIVEQVEFYFSNENILKDAFLLKHVRRNKEGFVSLKLVSSFKRVRQLTKDWRVVGYAIKLKSLRIELNDLGTKIRRLEALPVFDETTPSRTVVATDLPYEKLTIEKVSDLFSKCGEIALVRVLRPGGTIPSDVRQFINKYPELQEKECALVEFVESHSARSAQSMEGMTVYEMIAPKKKTGKKASVTKMVENFKYNEIDMERSRGGDYKYRVKRNNSGFFIKPTEQYICPPRKISFNNNDNFEHFHRRNSNCSDVSSRKYSNCSEGYSSCSEMSRRPSSCSEMSRRTSNCSDAPSSRRSSCSDFCHCQQRRITNCADMYRRMSQCSEHNRKYSAGSNCSDIQRRLSIESNHFDRKISSGSMGSNGGYEQPMRKFSTGFDMVRKISSGDQYYINRKISTDSGYDRKMSIDSGYDRKLSVGSDMSGGPRSRSGSLLINNIEAVVRTPIGPDGSKGFASRARKFGQTVPPV